MGLTKAQREAKAAQAQVEKDLAAMAAATPVQTEANDAATESQRAAAHDAQVALSEAQVAGDQQAQAEQAAAAAQAEADAAASNAADKLAAATDAELASREPAAAPTPSRSRRKVPSLEEAAAILRHPIEEVVSVEGSAEGPVVTIPDGHKYLLTGSEPGDYLWITEPAQTSALEA